MSDSTKAPPRAFIVVSMAMALGGCSMQPLAPPDKPSGATPSARAAPSAPTSAADANAIPPAVTDSLYRIVTESLSPGESAPALVAGEVKLKEIQLSPDGTASLVARGSGLLCRQDNCAVGVFDRASDGTVHPVLLAMSASEPQVYPIGVQGRQGITLTRIDGPHLLRNLRYRWDGATYQQEGCTLLDRATSVGGRCERTDLNNAPTYSGTFRGLCNDVLRIVRKWPDSLLASPLHEEAVLVRRTESVHVQALRIPSGDTTLATDLLGCLRKGGLRLTQQRSNDPVVPASSVWSAIVPSPLGSARIQIGWAELPGQPYSLISLGYFLASARPGLSYSGEANRSTWGGSMTKTSLEAQ